MFDTPRLIFGVDPGQATGLAWMLDDDFMSVDTTPLEACDKISRMLRLRGDRSAVVAVERYNITQRTVKLSRQYDALEIIGVCRWLAHAHRATFVLQGASDAQRCGNREVLRTLGWWSPGGDHRNKAAAQVALAYQQTFPHEFASRLEPGTII